MTGHYDNQTFNTQTLAATIISLLSSKFRPLAALAPVFVLLSACASNSIEPPFPVVKKSRFEQVETTAFESPDSSSGESPGESSGGHSIENSETSATKQTVLETQQSVPTNERLGSCLSERQRIGQLLTVLLTPKELPSIKANINRGEIGFIGLLGKPDKSIARTLKSLQSDATIPVLVASDEESKTVQRLAKAIEPLPTVKQLLALPSSQVQALFTAYGSRMRELGISINFAPVLDIGHGPGIRGRAFGTRVDKVVEYAGAVAQGLLDAGVMPVFKHFPGHGRASADSHNSLPVAPAFSDLEEDLKPYKQLLQRFASKTMNPQPNSANSNGSLGFKRSSKHVSGSRYQTGVMIAHLDVPGLTDGTPTSLSEPTITGLLRQTMGFNGLVFTDALNMGAISNSYSSSKAAVLALQAGADVAVLSGAADIESTIAAISKALNNETLSRVSLNHSVEKVLRLKHLALGNCES